jgi:hypothetical protein
LPGVVISLAVRFRFHDKVRTAMVPGSFSRPDASANAGHLRAQHACNRQSPAITSSPRSSAPGAPPRSILVQRKATAGRSSIQPGSECRTLSGVSGNKPAGPGEPGNRRGCRRGPFREQAGLAEAGGSHQDHQWLASGRGFRSTARCTGAPWAGHWYSDQLALDGHAVSVRMALLP